MECGYKACEAKGIDCKNKSHVLNIDSANLAQLRTIQSHARVVRFCCPEHMAKCKRSPKVQSAEVERRYRWNK